MKRGRPSINHAAALAAVFAAHRRYGTTRFRLNLAGPNAEPMKLARDLGWVWFPTPDTVVVTTEGVRALEPYGVKTEAGA